MLPISNILLLLLIGNILFKNEKKDRELTEKRILEAVGSIIENDGFEKIGVNAIAQRAGVSKMLIYRYFGGIDELIAQYLLQKDYWANTDMDIIKPSDIGGSLKRLFKEQIIRLSIMSRWSFYRMFYHKQIICVLGEYVAHCSYEYNKCYKYFSHC